jgi:hypothetical protein
MSITRSQIARELMAEGGAPRQGFLLGKLVKGVKKIGKKIKDDIIPNELKNPMGVAAALTAANFAPKIIPGGSDETLLQQFFPRVSEGLKTARGSVSNIFKGSDGSFDYEGDAYGTTSASDELKKVQDKSLLSRIGGGIGSVGSFLAKNPELASIGAGLIAGAFSKKEDDPLYTGQSVGLNLRDIRKLANISDPRTGSAIGLNFLPETRFRQFTPEQMAETYATTTPVEFTEQRESAEDGGIMGNQEDFNKFLEEMKKRDMGRMQEQILRDYEEFIKRKKMINQMPEVKGDGIMEEFKMAKGRTMAAGGGLMNLGGMEMDLRGGGFVPLGAKERADDVPARLSKNEFVFTADAVRAAGGGSVDKGADKMYATMKALENKVA